MKTYHLKIGTSNKLIRPGKLKNVHGSSPKGGSFGFTNYYMMRNGRPVIPVVGEFHYSRFSYLYWEEELLKMKAGGVNIVATYVFWNHHEEEEGVYEWSGNRNLRHFIDLCAKHELPLILRIGPFCHGEVRTGGMPDWVFSKPLEIRSNDELYLQLVRRLYREISRQIKGTFYQEGGPIIGVQLENEFMHAGAPFDAWDYKRGVFISSGSGANAHMDELRRIAEEVGIRPAFFTATAWGGAAVPERDTLPMLAGYAYTPWIPDQPPSGEYIYRDLHVTPMEKVEYDSEEYPVAYCEMAGGMQVSYNARPYVAPESVEAMTLVKLASGSNLLGYYMYHGGSNPVGKRGYLNESGLPKITYDYQSPLGEFGRVGESYDRIRTVAMMLDAYGEMMAPMGTVLPEGQSDIRPEDTGELRWCVRTKDGAGFLFLNNFQDHVDMPERDVRIELDTVQGAAAFPHAGRLTLQPGVSAVLPFHMDMSGARMISATVQPLTKLASDEPLYVFYAHDGIDPELVFSRSSVAEVAVGAGSCETIGDVWIVKPVSGKQHLVRLTLSDGSSVCILVLGREEALQTYRFRLWGEERVVISNSHLYAKDEQLVCTARDKSAIDVSIYPHPAYDVQTNIGAAAVKDEGAFRTYTVEMPTYEPGVNIRYPSHQSAMVSIDPAWKEQVSDVFLEIDYDGDVAEAFAGDRLLTDHIHYGKTWFIGLKQFQHMLADREIHLKITPLRKGKVHAFVNQAYVERFEGVEIAKFYSIRAVPHYTVRLSVT